MRLVDIPRLSSTEESLKASVVLKVEAGAFHRQLDISSTVVFLSKAFNHSSRSLAKQLD